MAYSYVLPELTERDLELILEALRHMSLQQLFGKRAEWAGEIAEELETWKALQDHV